MDPGRRFPADLTSIAVALATQAEGSILVHEWMFENRLIFTDKLILMGADIVMCDPHRAIVTGPRRLRGERVESPDIRAGMAMLLAALCAEGRSEIGNIRQIDRGYERIDERLRELGARIERVATEPPFTPEASADACASDAGCFRDHERLRDPHAGRQTPGYPPANRSNGETDLMIHPIPSGTRDVLPDETRELRAITDALRGVFERHGYGEVYTPALEYESVLAHADIDGTGPVHRVFDESGATLVLRSDMTVPIARLVATRYPASERPLRFCYFAHCYRGMRPQWSQPRELLQAGIELIGSPAPGGTAEALTVLCDALDATGLKDYRVGLGDASLFPTLMDRLQIAPDARVGLLETLAQRDFVELEQRLRGDRRLRRGRRAAAEPAPAPGRTRGAGRAAGAGRRRGRGHAPGERAADERVAARVIFDLGLVRSIGYYTGAVFEVYDPTLGVPIGGGGRYDDLLGRFGARTPRGRLRARTSNGCTSRSRARSAGRASSWWRRRDGDEREITMTDWLDDLTIAVPRGALFDGTVELLASLGLDTTELRGNDRKLLFEDIGVITMRPSDVPTYVEDGAADLGITGKDVLLERGGRASDHGARERGRRRSTSCSTSATGAARWCSPPPTASTIAARIRRPRRCAGWA